MPWKSHEKRKAESRKNQIGYRKAARAFIRAYKTKNPCVICGEAEPAALDFHHLNPDDKEFTLSTIAQNITKISRIDAEILKCIILCANCHRKFHAGLLEIPDRIPK